MPGLEVDQNNAVLHARGEDGKTRGLRGAHGHAGFEIEAASVQRADHGSPRHDPVAQRAALVRAGVLDRQETSVQIEDGYFDTTDAYRPSLARRYVLGARNLCPVSGNHT